MNDRNRWGEPRDERSQDYAGQDFTGQNGRRDRRGGQQGGWGGTQQPWRQGQHEQWQDDRGFDRGGSQGQPGWQGGQQGGWHDRAEAGFDRAREWTGSRDWGEPRPRGGDMRSQGWERPDDQPGPERSWSERAWGGSSLREGDRGLGGASGRARDGWGERDDHRRPGSQSFAAGYGMGDGPRGDPRGRARPEGWSGSSEPGYGRGYGPDYGRDDGRGFLERAGDRIAAWFGDDEGENRGDHRGERDHRGESHRGRGPGDYTRSDERIREDVNDRLTDDHRVDARRISVTVALGEVTLGGTVPDRESKRRAEDVAERVSGVRHVQNNLRIEMSGGMPAGGSQYTGQPTGTTTQAGGQASGAQQAGLGGGGRPDASAASPASGSSAQSGAASSGTAGGASGGSAASGAAGGSATGASTGSTTPGGSTGSGKSGG